MSELEIHGTCAPRFGPVKDAFARNFEQGLEVGASFAAVLDGESVVDLWAGHADKACARPWERDTIVNVYSTTKTMAALCALLLVERGELDLDAPVARTWPEFAAAGKERVPVRALLSHTSGLAGWDEPITVETLYDWDQSVSLLADQKPWWEPGTASGYHALTHGYLLGEMVRRISGRTLGAFFRDEVAGPLGVDFHIGLPEEHDPRVGELIPPEGAALGAELDPASIAARVLTNPRMTALEPRTRAWREAEIPAANGHGNARAVARVMGAIAAGELLGPATLARTVEEQSSGTDLVLGQPVRFGLGYGLQSPEVPIGPNPRTFFWGGWGGSLAVVDPDARLGFSYVMNKMGGTTTGDVRAFGPALALYDVLAR